MKESGEMYLETILILKDKCPVLRAVDLAEEMGLSKPSVSRALAKLREEGCITVKEQDGHIALTASGLELANKIYERHRVLTELFEALGVDSDTAANDACRIEHVISDTTFDAIKAHRDRYLATK